MTSGLQLSFQEQVARRARAFELPALLRLLRRYGYDRDEIYLESNPEASSRASLVQDVAFESGPPRRVVVVVNMGLLGSGSPLPSYFLRVIDEADDPQPFEDFIHYFDNVLLGHLLSAVMPEEDRALWGDRAVAKASYFGIIGPGSVATLTQAFRWYFPELTVRVHRRNFKQTTSAHACRTGFSRLDGSGVVGRYYQAQAEGFVAELYTEEEQMADGRSWPAEVRQRLAQRLLPLLARARIPLLVALNVMEHDGWAHLRFEGHLGFERVRAPLPGRHRMVIYAGVTGEARRAEG